MCTGRVSNQGPLGPKSDTLTTAPLRRPLRKYKEVKISLFSQSQRNAKFQDHRTSGSEEEDFLRFFTIYGHGGLYLGHVTWTIYKNIRSRFPRRIHMKFGFDQPSGFRGDV